jgi:hypothetical protein
MPANPGAKLDSKEKMPTTPADIGHVAPAFQDTQRFNTLIIRTEYRISIQLGDIEDLFPDAPNTAAGRMARMQVLGLFYYPLKHAQALTAFNGITAAAGPPVVRAVQGAWAYYKATILGGVDDAGADKEIQARLADRVLDGGSFPPPADDPTKPVDANFKKLRIPGGYSILSTWQPPALDLNNDPAAAYNGWTLGTDLYKVETQFRKDNPVLGQIPLVALVEKRDPDTNEWKPVKDAWVYFQLVDTYALPAFDATKDVNAQLNHPPLRTTSAGPPASASNAGPSVLVNREENPTGGRAYKATDPQKGNCPHDRGGAQGQGSLTDGTDVVDKLFLTKSTKGFNEDHSGTRKLPHPPYTVPANAAAGGKHAHAVKAKTNADGEAGVIFTPSRCGGDRYRIKAYIGPDTLKGPGSDGTGMNAVSVETGTLVLWRNLRMSRYVRQPVNNPAAVLLADVNNGIYNIGTNNVYLQKVFVVDSTGTNKGLSTSNFDMKVGTAGNYDSIPVQFARAFLETELDPGFTVPEVMTQADCAAARQQAFDDATQGMGTLGLNLNLTQLMHMEGGSTVNMANAVTHLPMRTRQAYNALVPAAQQVGTGGNSVARISRLFWQYAWPGFMRYFTGNGYRPGFTVIQAAYGATWQVWNGIGNNSGVSLEYRGVFLWGGDDFYPTAVTVPPAVRPPWGAYGFTSNVAHEIGHGIYRLHGPGQDPDNGAGGGANVNRHDSMTGNKSLCVMSYQTNEGQFCGRCLLAMRGWDEFNMPA